MLPTARLPEERSEWAGPFLLVRMRVGFHLLPPQGAGLAGEGALGACLAFEGRLRGLANYGGGGAGPVTKLGDSLCIEAIFWALGKCMLGLGILGVPLSLEGALGFGFLL